MKKLKEVVDEEEAMCASQEMIHAMTSKQRSLEVSFQKILSKLKWLRSKSESILDKSCQNDISDTSQSSDLSFVKGDSLSLL